MKRVVDFILALILAIIITVLIFAPVLLMAQKIETINTTKKFTNAQKIRKRLRFAELQISCTKSIPGASKRKNGKTGGKLGAYIKKSIVQIRSFGCACFFTFFGWGITQTATAQKIEFIKVDTITTTFEYTRDSVYITETWPCGYQWDPEAVDLKLIYRSRRRAIKNKTNGNTGN